MNKKRINQMLLIGTMLTAALFSACSNNDNTEQDQTISANKTIRFQLIDEDFGADTEIDATRAGQDSVLGRDTINLGNNIIAEMSVERDAKQTPTTRAAGMSNGTYTVLAYQGGVLKGTLKGTVTSNVFTATSSNQDIILAPGTYTFYCCNDKVDISGDHLNVSLANAGTARIGTTTVTLPATPHRQTVSFAMKHVGARIRYKFEGYMPFYVNARPQYKAWGTSTLDATTGSYTYSDPLTTWTPIGSLMYVNASNDGTGTYTATTSDYAYILPSATSSDLEIKINSLNIYKKSLSGIVQRVNNLPRTFYQNGSYTIKITLQYNYKLLYSDGTVDPLLPNGTPNHSASARPIGVVVTDNNGTAGSGMAIALEDARKSDGDYEMDEYSAAQAINYYNTYGPYSSITTGANLSQWYLPSLAEWYKALTDICFSQGYIGGSASEMQSIYYAVLDKENVSQSSLSPGAGTIGNKEYWTSEYGKAVGIDWNSFGYSTPGTGYAGANYSSNNKHVRPFIHF